MKRALHLGPAGEQVVRELLDGYVLNSFFEPCFLLSAYPSALDEARRRMAERAGRLIHWPPGRDLLARTEALTEELGPSDEMAPDERPVIWLQQTTFEAEDWSDALHSLNWHRGTYHRNAPWMWVLAGPDELLPIAREQASHLMPSVVTRWLPDKPALPPHPTVPARPVRWLHLSDFHFRGLEMWDRRATLKALLAHVADLRERDLAPDLVLVTGDVAASGQRKEYEQAERFFTALAQTLDLKPADRFFIVPGNHDVDRDAIGPEEHVLRGIATQEEIEKVLTDPQMMGMLSRRLEAFYAFTERFLGPARGWRPERPWRVDVRDVAGVAVGILQLNSAWASGTNDERGLLVGKAQVQDALEKTPDAFLRIALVHHSIADLRDVDRKPLETLIGADEVHFLLRGHLHRSRSAVAETPDGLLVELAAGAVYPGGDYPKTHLLTETDLSAGQGRVRFFRFSDEGQGFWAPDTLVYQKARDGVWTFPLAAHLRIDTDTPASAGELSDARRSTLTARYRAAAAAVHGTLRFAGLASHRPRPNVRVPELFVPLRLKVWETGEDAPGWTTAELIARLAQPVGNGKAARVVILGGPGTGKTTLCRFVMVCLAGEGPREYAALGQERLPLFLQLRDYVRACNEGGDRSLLDFLVDEARNRLQVPAPQSFFEQALDEGRAVLLLDGFDEVGSADAREGMRERVQALCRLYPRTPVLLTSRTAGYEDAPVSRHSRSTPGFDHLVLTEFDDEDLHQFMARWYAMQEPDDPVARDRGIADLTASIELNPHVRNLARNPMLATLIALVHRYEAHLPGERAMLYDRAVKTLIEAWPAARRLRFREIDEPLQRAYLEELAFRMQSARGEDDREVVIRRDALIGELVDIIQRRKISAHSPEETTGLVERWIRFLEEKAGILVEQQPVIFGFLHLSLMEYLAAGGLEAVVDEALEEAVARRCTSAVWREVCLLVVGRWATKKLFVDRLYRRLSEDGQWFFLLACLREEAAFDDEQRASIIRNVARQRHVAASWEWRRQEEILDGVMRLSIRHATWARSWIGQQIRSAEGNALAGIVALRLGRPDALISEINGRSDAGLLAGDLLDFWPHHPVGRWAVKRVSPQRALDWALRRAGDDFIVLRSRAALTAYSQALAAPLVARLARSAAELIPAAQAWTDSLAAHPWPGDHGSPLMVQAEPGFNRTGIRPRWPVPETPWPAKKKTSSGSSLGQDFYRYFTAELVEDLRGDFTVRFGNAAHPPWPIDLYFIFSRDIDPGFPRDFAEILADDFRKYLIVFFMDNIPFADFRLKLVFDNGDQLALWNGGDGLGKASRYLPSIPAPTRCESAAAIHPESYVPEVLARRAAQAWVALATTVGRPDDERRAYLRQRLVHGEILSVWPALDARLGERPSVDALALYLTLGWTQATTTWQWPATERWVGYLGRTPSAHWLPRSQWHLCWLLHDPQDDGHRQGLDDALDKGLDDPDCPGVAVLLRSLFPKDHE